MLVWPWEFTEHYSILAPPCQLTFQSLNDLSLAGSSTLGVGEGKGASKAEPGRQP